MPRRAERGFIWVPRDQTTSYKIEIDGTDRTTDILAGGNIEFSLALLPEVGAFKFNLESADGSYSSLYDGGETVEIYLDFVDGSTKVFTGTLERVENSITDEAYVLKCEGSHASAEMLDVNVTKAYDGSTSITDIFKDLFDTYLTGFTYTNLGSFSATPTITWQDKPLLDCVTDLLNLADADAYIGADKDLHVFVKSSINNDSEAAVWNDTLIEIEGLGTDTIDVRNKVRVVGRSDDGSLISYTAEDTASQATYNVKTKVVRDENIQTYAEAKERADAELSLLKATKDKGSVKSWVLPSLMPGDMFYVVSPGQKVHARYRAAVITHQFPEEFTEVDIESRTSLPKVLKKQFERSLGQEDIQNINDLSFAFSYPFNDFSDIDTDSSTANIGIVDGKAYITSGADGVLITKVHNSESDATLVEVRVVGEACGDVELYVSAVDPVVWESVSPTTLKSLSSSGSKIRVKAVINSTSTRIDSLTGLYS